MVKSARNFFVKIKKSYRNIQYSYLLSKSLRNLFPGFLDRPKCQIVLFSGAKHNQDAHEGTSATRNISFQSRCTSFCLKNVLNIS